MVQPGKEKETTQFSGTYTNAIIKLCRDQKEKNTIIIGYVISLAGRK